MHQVSDRAALSAHLAGGARRAYIGFDPTADSLTIGNLVPIMLLLHFRLAGHEPIALCGGGTGLIGDPSGKSAERLLLSEERVRANVESQRGIFARVFANAGAQAPEVVNNIDWLGTLGYIQVLRDVGKYFSVNQMIQRDNVRSRLESREQGISYTEFSYMILQAYDFLHLFRERGVTLQMGGSDQWGNIVSGADLIRRSLFASVSSEYQARTASKAAEVAALAADPNFGAPGKRVLDLSNAAVEVAKFHAIAHEAEKAASPFTDTAAGSFSSAFALTAPLVTKSDGTKFGKSESGAVWLSARAGPDDTSTSRTSAYAYFQFWLNSADADVGRFLRTFTLMTREEIESLERDAQANPGARTAQRALARAATRLLHGPDEARRAEEAAQALFSGELRALSAETLEDVLAGVASSDHALSALDGAGGAGGLKLVELLAMTSLAKSKSEARQFLGDGSVSVNGTKATLETALSRADLLHGRLIALRRGKKAWHVCRFA